MNVDYLRLPDEQQAGRVEQSASIPLESLTLDPFANTRDSRFYFASVLHQSAVDQLKDMLDDGNQGWGCLSSAPGLGKTLLRTVLHKSLETNRYLGVSIENSLLDFDQLLLEIISQVSGERAYHSDFPDRYSRLAEFKILLTEHVVQSGRHLVVFLDEAQEFEKKTMENLRNLSNICAEQANLMSIILIGDTRLDSTLRGLPALGQRIAVRANLLPLDIEQTGAYVQHRLQVAGSEQPLPFGEEDLQHLHRVSQGIPREINTILKQAINLARHSSKGLSAESLRKALNARSAATSGHSSEFKSLGMS
jgi:type II secretory pathway predicted ATPase ExeA